MKNCTHQSKDRNFLWTHFYILLTLLSSILLLLNTCSTFLPAKLKLKSETFRGFSSLVLFRYEHGFVPFFVSLHREGRRILLCSKVGFACLRIMGRGNWVFRALFGAVLIVGVVWFFSVGVLARSVDVSNEEHEHWSSTGRGKHHSYKDSDLHFVIKRRVPNGPDPIHNRRASLSRQPPGRT